MQTKKCFQKKKCKGYKKKRKRTDNFYVPCLNRHFFAAKVVFGLLPTRNLKKVDNHCVKMFFFLNFNKIALFDFNFCALKLRDCCRTV